MTVRSLHRRRILLEPPPSLNWRFEAAGVTSVNPNQLILHLGASAGGQYQGWWPISGSSWIAQPWLQAQKRRLSALCWTLYWVLDIVVYAGLAGAEDYGAVLWIAAACCALEVLRVLCGQCLR